ncbi:2-octaprenyl-6-methoxyphenyl hydroxylase [Neptuniibacter pectenicola]|uniref:2-octaprenyl-6-methoxyphenyl hydroxylase n=1 Tax=Neptuniibacter pectenicola TaxID=1806669 RepID=A0ABU9TUE0_9GAMM
MKQHYDIVIIGGGMVGASLACALLPMSDALDLNIAVIESVALPTHDVEEYQPSYDARSTALAYGSRSIYEAMGVWTRLKAHVSPISDIHVSDKGHFGVTRLNAKKEGVSALGYVVENQWLGHVLLDHLQQAASPRIDFICPASVTAVESRADSMGVTVEYQGEHTELSCELVVMADGGRSPLRASMGISYSETTYDQHAIVVNVSTDQPHNGVAYERFTDSGPMALLPLEDKGGSPRSALVWTVPNDLIDEVLGLDDQAFIARFHERFGYRAGNVIHVGQRFSYPLKLTVADEQVRRGLVVLGNAAHALHPIAGQGYNLALRGVASLAETLIHARKQQQNLGDLTRLQAFYEQQRLDQVRTIGFSDQTMKLFSNHNPLLAVGRNVGLQLLDICPTAKTLFARSAMGLDMPAPDLK